MELSYLQNCHTCGAPIELEEADRVIECAFCDGKSFMTEGQPLRFVLPHILPRDIREEEVYFIPYIRFKGHIYSCQGFELSHKIIDTTQLGYGSSRLPHTLGLRPQAMNLQIVGRNTPGRFVKLTEKVKDIFHKAAKLTTAFSETDDILYHRAFIGETISIIYLPTYFKDDILVDGVLNRQLATNIPQDILRKLSSPVKKEWVRNYIATRCPHCGASMSASRDSLVLECRNCKSLWEEKNGAFSRLKYSVVQSENAELHLPFWKIAADVQGVELGSFGKYLQLTNQPVVRNENVDKIAFYQWVPAFKIRPRYFIHFAKNLTLSQIKLSQGTTALGKRLYPATLPLSEAFEALKTTIAAAVMNKRSFLPNLPKIKIHKREAEMVFLPFHYLGHDLVQDHTGVTVAANILHYGRTM